MTGKVYRRLAQSKKAFTFQVRNKALQTLEQRALQTYIFEPRCDTVLMVAVLTRELNNFAVLLHAIMTH